MNFAVRRFKNFPTKVDGAPDDYPAEVRGIGTSTDLPPGAGWELMTAAEVAAAKAANATAFQRWQAKQKVAGSEKHLVREYNALNHVSKETWYASKNSGTGAYENKVREIVYTYSGNIMLSATESVFDSLGNATVINVSTYKTETVGTTLKHIEEGS